MASLAVLPALAAAVAGWFPELGGRAIAVSEAEITRENIPTLPVCMLALVREVGNGRGPGGSTNVEIEEEFIAEFWLTPERYKNAAGAESPFWSFYDYDTFRDVLLTNLRGWRSPRNGSVSYASLDIEVTAFAVVLSFRLKHHFKWCPLDNGDENGEAPVAIVANICTPVPTYCGPLFEAPTDCESPCP